MLNRTSIALRELTHTQAYTRAHTQTHTHTYMYILYRHRNREENFRVSSRILLCVAGSMGVSRSFGVAVRFHNGAFAMFYDWLPNRSKRCTN